MKNDKRRLVHERSREGVAASGDASTSVGLSRLVATWRETKMRPHRSRSRKSTRIFNCADVNQGREGTDARDRHQKTADRIRSDLLPHCLIENSDLLTQLAPGGEQRTHDRTDFGRALEKRFDLPIKS